MVWSLKSSKLTIITIPCNGLELYRDIYISLRKCSYSLGRRNYQFYKGVVKEKHHFWRLWISPEIRSPSKFLSGWIYLAIQILLVFIWFPCVSREFTYLESIQESRSFSFCLLRISGSIQSLQKTCFSFTTPL